MVRPSKAEVKERVASSTRQRGDEEFDELIFNEEASASQLVVGSLDDCLEQAWIIQRILAEQEVTWHPSAPDSTSRIKLIVDEPHLPVFMRGGPLDIALRAKPHLDLSGLRPYRDANRSLEKDMAYSASTCIGLMEWGRRAHLELKTAEREGRSPRIHFPCIGRQTANKSYLILPVCLWPLLIIAAAKEFQRQECPNRTDFLLEFPESVQINSSSYKDARAWDLVVSKPGDAKAVLGKMPQRYCRILQMAMSYFASSDTGGAYAKRLPKLVIAAEDWPARIKAMLYLDGEIRDLHKRVFGPEHIAVAQELLDEDGGPSDYHAIPCMQLEQWQIQTSKGKKVGRAPRKDGKGKVDTRKRVELRKSKAHYRLQNGKKAKGKKAKGENEEDADEKGTSGKGKEKEKARGDSDEWSDESSD